MSRTRGGSRRRGALASGTSLLTRREPSLRLLNSLCLSSATDAKYTQMVDDPKLILGRGNRPIFRPPPPGE